MSDNERGNKKQRKLRHLRDSLRQSLGIGLVALLAWLGRPVSPWLEIGAVLVVLGVAVRLWASGYVKKNKELATCGPYAWVRHPLYVGNLLLTLGFCLAANRWWAYLLMGAFVLFFYPNAIRQEDSNLHRLFGSQWEAWRAQTRALIPTSPYRQGDAGQWSFVYSLRRNGEPWIAAFLLVCLAVLWHRLG